MFNSLFVLVRRSRPRSRIFLEGRSRARTRRRRERVITATVALSVIVGFSPAQAEPLAPADVKALLGRIKEKRAAAPQMQAEFQEQKTMKMMNKPISSSGKVWFQSPNKFRRELRGNAPSTTVSNGQQLWIYYPKFQSAEKYTLGKRSPLDAGIAAITASLNLQDVEQTYNINASREGGGYVLQLTPRTGSLEEAAPAVHHPSGRIAPGAAHGDAATKRGPHRHDLHERIARIDPRLDVRIHAACRHQDHDAPRRVGTLRSRIPKLRELRNIRQRVRVAASRTDVVFGTICDSSSELLGFGHRGAMSLP